MVNRLPRQWFTGIIPKMSSIKIAIVAGTNRPGSNSLKIAEVLRGFYEKSGAEISWIDLQTLPPEVFHPDVYKVKPESFKPFSQAILEAHGLVFVVPEYNGSLPGILKYFIDLLKFPESFEGKPVAFVGLGGRFGGLRPVEHLMQIFSYRNGHLFPERVFISDIKKEMSEEGILKSPELLKRLEGQSERFLDFVRHLKSR